MWLSEQTARPRQGVAAASVGEVTIAGESFGVMTDSEKREMPIATPGGYMWRPKAGDSVLVIKSDEGEKIAAGIIDRHIPTDLGDGDICIKTDSAEFRISGNGSILIKGEVSVDGSLTINGMPYKPCSCEPGGLA